MCGSQQAHNHGSPLLFAPPIASLDFSLLNCKGRSELKWFLLYLMTTFSNPPAIF